MNFESDAKPYSNVAPDARINIEFLPDFRLLATEPHTGAEVPLGYNRLGAWSEVSISRDSVLCRDSFDADFRLRHDVSLSSFDCPIDHISFAKLVEETTQRCYYFAQQIAIGNLPVLRHSVEVWPVLGGVRQIGVGENIPASITHLRRSGTTAWVLCPTFYSLIPLKDRRSR